MKIKNCLLSIFIIELALVAIPFAGTAMAAPGDTQVTFVINPYSGGLAIAVPADVTFSPLTSPENASTVSAIAPTVTVTDTRRGSNITWITTAVASDLISSGDTLTANAISYSSGVITKSGTVVCVEHDQAALDLAVTVVSSSGIYGNHVASWTPTIVLAVPALQAPGTYVGTITHSVS